MQAEVTWTRRKLLKVGGLGVGAGVASGFGVPAYAEAPSPTAETQNAYVYVASAGASPETHGVRVYAVRGARWEPLQCVSSAAPSSLALSIDGKALYVTNGIGCYKGLPTGSVEAWAIDGRTGRLELLNRQGLALTAVFPSHAAVSPDGSMLAVAAAHGGSCVLLPVREDGSLGEPTAVRKELRLTSEAGITSVPRAAQLCFVPDGKLLLADFSEHVVSVLSFTSGPLELVKRMVLPEACTSASLRRDARSIDVRFHDDAQRELGMLSYADQLTLLTWADSSRGQRRPYKQAPLKELVALRSPVASLPL